MEFRVRFYQTANGEKPLVGFLADLRRKQPRLHQLVVAGLEKLKDRGNWGLPLTRPIQGEEGLYELRVGDTDIARVFFFLKGITRSS